MLLGVNVPNFGPGTNPDVLLRWAQTVEGLGYDLLMVSDHIAVTPDVAIRYPAPFYEPFTTLAWLAGVTSQLRLGTTVLVTPYRHPLLVARMAANLNQISKRGLILGVGVGGKREEFAALGIAFERRGRLTDEHLEAIRTAWTDERDYGADRIPMWVGGNSDAALRRAVRVGDAWHPMKFTPGWLDEASIRLSAAADEAHRSVPALAPRIALRLSHEPLPDDRRLVGEGTIEQVCADLEHLRKMGAPTVLLDPYNGDPEETRQPETAWAALEIVADAWNRAHTPTETEKQ
ncbi:MAG: LLM class flavin-dependent oxidoreductase [Actinomycetota bacterium]|nr:LLM class flavin-dependent oxidoreductase [Actinomycetota bacterium]